MRYAETDDLNASTMVANSVLTHIRPRSEDGNGMRLMSYVGAFLCIINGHGVRELHGIVRWVMGDVDD